jgi:hypothetical protein
MAFANFTKFIILLLQKFHYKLAQSRCNYLQRTQYAILCFVLSVYGKILKCVLPLLGTHARESEERRGCEAIPLRAQVRTFSSHSVKGNRQSV